MSPGLCANKMSPSTQVPTHTRSAAETSAKSSPSKGRTITSWPRDANVPPMYSAARLVLPLRLRYVRRTFTPRTLPQPDAQSLLPDDLGELDDSSSMFARLVEVDQSNDLPFEP